MKKNKISIVFIAISAVIGVIAGHAPWLLQIYMTLFAASLLFLALMVFILYLFLRDKPWIKIGTTMTIMGIVMVAFFILSSLTFKKIYQNQANSLISELENFESQNGHFPKNLDTLNLKSKRITYEPDSTLHSFKLWYSLNGWESFIYKSDSKEWIMID